MVDARLEQIKILVIGKHPLDSLFHRAVVRKKLFEWNQQNTEGM